MKQIIQTLVIGVIGLSSLVQAANVNIIKKGTGMFPVLGSEDALYCSLFNNLPIKSSYVTGLGMVQGDFNNAKDFLSKPDSLNSYLLPIPFLDYATTTTILGGQNPYQILYRFNDVLGKLGQAGTVREAHMDWKLVPTPQGGVKIQFKKVCNPNLDPLFCFLQKEGPDGKMEALMNPHGNDLNELLKKPADKPYKEIVYVCGQIDLNPTAQPLLSQVQYQLFWQLSPQQDNTTVMVQEMIVEKFYQDFFKVLEAKMKKSGKKGGFSLPGGISLPGGFSL